MKRRAFALAGLAGAAALLTSCTTTPVLPSAPAGAVPPPQPGGDGTAETPPPAPREFRAAWVSTVANIDWPSRPGLTAAQQQAEAIAILDRAAGLRLNAVILQVRPAADALYASSIEPWSEYLTGTQGQAPQPWYDPLKFWVTQAHARGLELHAWFNPYRARHSAARSPLAPGHIANTHPEAVRQYGKYLWLDPAEPAAEHQTLAVILDVVRRYDIDGVHIDDYFYPYPEAENGLEGAAGKNETDFPDQAPWSRYVLAGGTLDKPSWRRGHVNRLIESLYAGIHRVKPWVKFGISPFGIGRPDRRPSAIAGFSQYDKLYADAELWLENGWLDYFAPQLYWPIDAPQQGYAVLLDYWLAQNARQRHVWPGLYTSRIGAPTRDYPPEEIVQEIALTRLRPAATGHVHFSIAALMENRKGIADELLARVYTASALVPATPWLAPADATPVPAPAAQLRRTHAGFALRLAPGAGGAAPAQPITHYAIWTRYGTEWRFASVPAGLSAWTVADDSVLGPAAAIVLSAVDRLGIESARATLALKA